MGVEARYAPTTMAPDTHTNTLRRASFKTLRGANRFGDKMNVRIGRCRQAARLRSLKPGLVCLSLVDLTEMKTKCGARSLFIYLEAHRKRHEPPRPAGSKLCLQAGQQGEPREEMGCARSDPGLGAHLQGQLICEPCWPCSNRGAPSIFVLSL